jgi:hypothetical protein
MGEPPQRVDRERQDHRHEERAEDAGERLNPHRRAQRGRDPDDDQQSAWDG